MSSAPMTETRARSIANAQRIDAACDRWEKAWQSGESCRLEDYLAAVEEPLRPALLRQLLLLQWEYLQQRGEPIELADYLARFPEHSQLINDASAEHTLETESARKEPIVDADRKVSDGWLHWRQA